MASGLASSLPSGIETPAEIDLRKTSEGAPLLASIVMLTCCLFLLLCLLACCLFLLCARPWRVRPGGAVRLATCWLVCLLRARCSTRPAVRSDGPARDLLLATLPTGPALAAGTLGSVGRLTPISGT